MKRVLLILAFLLCTIPAQAANLYVATTGSDSNAGTIGSPFLTAQHAYTAVAACGDTIYIRGGTYDGKFVNGRVVYSNQAKSVILVDEIHSAVTTACGSYANGITIRNYPGEDVRLTRDGLGPAQSITGLASQAIDDSGSVHVHDDYYLTFQGEAGHPIVWDGTTMARGFKDSDGNWNGSACIGGLQANHVRFWHIKCDGSSGNGVGVDADYNEFDYMEVSGIVYTHGAYLSQGNHFVIDHSSFHDNGCYGMQIYDAVNLNIDDNIVRNSVFYNNNYISVDIDGNPVPRHVSGCGGGLVISSGHRDLVYNNIFYDNGAYGLVVFTSMYDCQILNNTIARNQWGLRSSGVRCNVQNNLISGQTLTVDAEGGTGGIDIDDINGSNTTIVNNITAANGDPKFTNASPTPPDLTLQSTSPAIGYAANLTGAGYFTTDYLGNTRVASGAWTAGAYDNNSVPTPSLVSISPISLVQGATSQTLTLVGANTSFSGSSVFTTGCSGVTVNSTGTPADATHITANVSVSGGATVATCDITVTTGAEVVTKTNGFSVTAAATPAITSVSPASAIQGQSNVDVAVTETNAHSVNGTTVCALSAPTTGITIVSTTVSGSNALTVRISFSGSVSTGLRNLTCTTNAEVIVATNAFTVNAATGCALSGAPSIVTGQCVHQGNPDVDTTIVSPSLPLSVDNTTGHYVGFATLIDKNGGTTSNPVTSVDSACGFTYTKVASGATNLIVQLEIRVAPVTSSCSEHATAHYGADMYFGVGFLREFHDLAPSSVKDAEATSTGTSETPSLSITASVANDLIWSVILSSSASITATSPATGIESIDNYADMIVVPASSGAKTQAFGTSNAFYNELSVALKPNTSTPATLSSVSPIVAQRCNPDVSMTMTGLNSNFDQDVSFPNMDDLGGITNISFTVNSPTSAAWHFAVSCGASLITRNVSVVTNSEVAAGRTFTVQPTGGNSRFHR